MDEIDLGSARQAEKSWSQEQARNEQPKCNHCTGSLASWSFLFEFVMKQYRPQSCSQIRRVASTCGSRVYGYWVTAVRPKSAPEPRVNDVGEEVDEGVHQQGAEVLPKEDGGPTHLCMLSAAQIPCAVRTV